MYMMSFQSWTLVPIRPLTKKLELADPQHSRFETSLCWVQPFYQNAFANYSCCPTIWIHLEDQSDLPD